MLNGISKSVKDMKRILWIALFASVSLFSFGDDCDAPFNTLRFCEELEKDGVVIDSEIVLNSDCTWEWHLDDITAFIGTWYRNDPRKIHWLVFIAEDPTGVEEPVESVESLNYSIDPVTKDFKFRSLTFLGTEMLLCGEE